MATHGIFSGSSIETILLNTDFIRKIVVTNTVPQVANRAKMPDILQVIDISGKTIGSFIGKIARIETFSEIFKPCIFEVYDKLSFTTQMWPVPFKPN